MNKSIMLGKTWGSKAFVESTKVLEKKTSNRALQQIMYTNMSKAITF